MSLSISYTFSPTTTIESGQVNQNFADIVTYINETVCKAGMAMFWTGSIATIPTGWALDTNSRDKFIIGAGNLYNPGDTGGEATHTLTESEMPSHTHIQNQHKHAVTLRGDGDSGSGAGNAESSNTSASSAYNTDYTTPTNQNTGGGTAHNNLPPYYSYAIIKKS